jgi:hypothetical protein
MRMCLLSLLPLMCATVWADGSGLADAQRQQVLAEWERDGGRLALPRNPNGEVMGAATFDDAAGGVDGKKTGAYGFHTTYQNDPWWQVDLEDSYALGRVVVYNRNESQGLMERNLGMRILVSQDGQDWQMVFAHTGPAFGGAKDGRPLVVDLTGRQIAARFVRCQVPHAASFHLDEVEIYPADDPATNIALNKPADQSSAGRSSVSHGKARTLPVDTFTAAMTAQVLTRGRLLLERLSTLDGDPRTRLAAALEAAQARAEALPTSGDAGARREVYLAAREAVRDIVLSNPLLNFRSVLYVKREPGVLAHMCDQYFGSLQRPGGGLYVLEDVLGQPRERDLIAGRLPAGAYLSPALSYDGRTVVFAFARGEASRKPYFSYDAQWRYHLFRVNVDGSDLRQLTDGAADDILPCWLPDGDLVFMSTRRGGETRCSGRPVPTYTLHRMAADGSGLRRLSDHETHEWHPSVLNDGSLLYTRWDYVDRHTNLAHSLWQCRPDGSAPMAVFGNYNYDRKPWGLWWARPIPDSQRIIAVAGAHHGYAYGSLVMVDPLRAFDGQTALTRLTPDVDFPEAEGYQGQAYGSPWPLSEDFWLGTYSPDWSTHSAAHGVHMGLYILDRFGNRELLLRDPSACIETPVPLCPRPVPNPYPSGDVAAADQQGRFMLLNAYASNQPLPDARIRSLRIVQILPKTTYRADDPRVSIARQISARMVVGTVPVEADGSSHFTAPIGVPLYFQTLDEHGRAVQTMRSATYLKPGETRSCQGCHEPRQGAPTVQRPLAALREASTPQAGPDGSAPFSYLRLVQPVLDRNCVRCHATGKPAARLPLTSEFASDAEAFNTSYKTLARKSLVPWFDSVNGGEWIPQTTPGQFGARTSKIIAMLLAGHSGVSLAPDDLERLTIWIDLNVPFYGCYEPDHVAMQRRGEVVPLEQMLQ